MRKRSISINNISTALLELHDEIFPRMPAGSPILYRDSFRDADVG